MRKPLTLLLILTLCTPGWAVKTTYWTQTSEADFQAGTFEQTVATNLGDVKLSRDVKLLLGADPRVSAVFCLAEARDGTIYAGTGPQGVLLAVSGGKASHALDVGSNTSITSLLVDSQGRLLIGTAGEAGRILRLDKPGGKPEELFRADGVQYVWSMTQSSDGTLYAATGPNGQLFAIAPDGSNKVLFDSDEDNLLCVIGDGKDRLYVGTDPNGLIYRIDRRSGEMFVLYDAGETEVNTLALDAKGNLYAATAQAAEDAGTAEPTGATEQMGRPEVDPRGPAIPSEPPKVPEPPELPLPGPGDPNPIPRQVPSPGAASPQSDASPLTFSLSPNPGRWSEATSFVMLQDKPDGPDGEEPGKPGKPEKPSDEPAQRPGRGVVPAQPGAPTGAVGEPAASGNAVYRIDPDGFVTEIFRAPVVIYSIVERNGILLLATGNEGRIYELNPAAEETGVVAKTEPKQVLSILPSKDGKVYLGLANTGEIAVMSAGFASQGTYTSPVLDAQQVSRFGKIRLRGSLPAGATLRVSTRSGNVQETTDPGWSAWSEPVPAAEFLQITSPAARFLQYRLHLGSDAGKQSPVLDEVSVAYQLPNLPPQVKGIKVAEPESATGASGTEAAEPTSTRTISWDATDPNEDVLEYTLFFRSSPAAAWVQLKDKITDNSFEWNTRTVADGRYQVRVVASDAKANPADRGRSAARVSDPVVVDNTPPVIGNVSASVQGEQAKVTLTTVDRMTTVAAVEYAADGRDDWQTVLPSDKIADSPEETYEWIVPNLGAGAHQIAVRATDAHGNRSIETVAVTVEAKQP